MKIQKSMLKEWSISDNYDHHGNERIWLIWKASIVGLQILEAIDQMKASIVGLSWHLMSDFNVILTDRRIVQV